MLAWPEAALAVGPYVLYARTVRPYMHRTWYCTRYVYVVIAGENSVRLAKMGALGPRSAMDGGPPPAPVEPFRPVQDVGW